MELNITCKTQLNIYQKEHNHLLAMKEIFIEEIRGLAHTDRYTETVIRTLWWTDSFQHDLKSQSVFYLTMALLQF